MADYLLSYFPQKQALVESHTNSKSKVEANLLLPLVEQKPNVFIFKLYLNMVSA